MQVEPAKEGTLMAEFQKERTEAISEMFDNIDEHGIYPTSEFFIRIDEAARRLTIEAVKIAIKSYTKIVLN